MNCYKSVRNLLVLFICLLVVFPAVAADSTAQVPQIVQDGFNIWGKKGASYAFDAWKAGGVLENDNKPSALSNYFFRMDRTIGNLKSYDLVQSKRVSQNSQIIYLSMNFEKAAIYARFLLYRTEKGWVVQNMDFSPKPEALMPWLAFAGESYNE